MAQSSLFASVLRSVLSALLWSSNCADLLLWGPVLLSLVRGMEGGRGGGGGGGGGDRGFVGRTGLQASVPVALETTCWTNREDTNRSEKQRDKPPNYAPATYQPSV